MDESISSSRKFYISCMGFCMLLSLFITCSLVMGMILYVLLEGLPNITWELLSTKPSYLTETIGILPDILNTIYLVIGTLAIVLPLGVGAAI